MKSRTLRRYLEKNVRTNINSKMPTKKNDVNVEHVIPVSSHSKHVLGNSTYYSISTLERNVLFFQIAPVAEYI